MFHIFSAIILLKNVSLPPTRIKKMHIVKVPFHQKMLWIGLSKLHFTRNGMVGESWR